MQKRSATLVNARWDWNGVIGTAQSLEVRRLGADKHRLREIAGDDAVVIACDRELPFEELTVGYAMTSNGVQMRNASRACRWGKLRDSDPFVGTTTKTPQPNFCVSFEMPAFS